MHCNGKCFLMKKLKQAEEREKKQERENRFSAHADALPSISLSITFKKVTYKISYPERGVKNTIHRSTSIFQPPKVV